MKVSRTTNPLHFEDLEPHRFEDLVRQLAYDFREWQSLEAVGRSGADAGVDILARERDERLQPILDEDALDSGTTAVDVTIPRTWIIQCKREKTLNPARARRYTRDSLGGKSSVYGYILAAAADFSTKTRLAVRAEAAAQGVEAVHLWGKAELEDMLFQPEHDHLLFAYFGISLQIRRRSAHAELVARIAIKRKLIKVIPLREPNYSSVLIRDPRATGYPFIEDIVKFREQPSWRYYEPCEHLPPDHVRFIVSETEGWLDTETGEWDIPSLSPLMPANSDLFNLPDDYWNREHAELRTALESVPENRKATIRIYGYLSYDRILAVDDIGDALNPGCHLLVYRDDEFGFFEPNLTTALAIVSQYEERKLEPEKRIEFF